MDEQNKPLSQTPVSDDQGNAAPPQTTPPSPEVTVDFGQSSDQGVGTPNSNIPGDSASFGTDVSSGANGVPDGTAGTTDAPSSPTEPPATDSSGSVASGDGDLGAQAFGSQVDSTAPTASTTPPPVTDNFADAPENPVPGGFPAQDSSQPFNPVPDGNQAPLDSSVPPTAPVTAPHTSDKKTILILGLVAVVLIAAIAVLFFM